jgi:hypothetical protein
MQTNTPIQYSSIGQIIKKALHTKIGAWIGYLAGIAGFNRIDSYIIRANGKVKRLSPTYNARVNAGAALCASLISGTALGGITSPAAAKYIALSTASLTPAYGDTTLASETSATGLARALGTAGAYTSPGTTLDGAASYTLTKTFTNTSGGSVTIQSAAIFDATSTGNMFVEANLSSSAILANNDSLAITWTINL